MVTLSNADCIHVRAAMGAVVPVVVLLTEVVARRVDHQGTSEEKNVSTFLQCHLTKLG